MADKSFFKPTQLYKEYMILDLIEKNKDITQREIASHLGIAVSMINNYLEIFDKDKLIQRKKHTTKTVEYFITNKGKERRKVLNIGYLKHSQIVYNSAREGVEKFLEQLENKGIKNLFLYGAGEVAEILLNSIYSSEKTKLKILGVIDDNQSKIGRFKYETPVVPLELVNSIEHDGILISSYTNKNSIIYNLNKFNYDSNKIFNFFDT